MAKEVRGFVRRVFKRPGTGRNGKPYILYSFKLATPEGQEDPTWYQLGFNAPNVKEDWDEAQGKYTDGGSYVKFSAETAPDGKSAKVPEDSLKRLKNPPARQPVQAPQGGQGGGYRGKGGGGPKEKDSKLFGKIGGYNTEDDVRRMSYASARGDAIAAIKVLLENDGLAITGAKTKAGQAKRFSEIVAAIDKLTVKFFFDNASGRQLELVADTLVTKPSATPLPEDAEGEDSVEDEDVDADESEEDEESEDTSDDDSDADEEIEDDEEVEDDE
jgi:hypothetical protein